MDKRKSKLILNVSFAVIITILMGIVGKAEFGCGKSETKTETGKTERHFLPQKLVGSYETKAWFQTQMLFRIDKLVFLKNGKVEGYLNGKISSKIPQKDGILVEKLGTWKVVSKEVHLSYADIDVFVFRIEPNGDLTWIARLWGGQSQREVLSKEHQLTFKKLK